MGGHSFCVRYFTFYSENLLYKLLPQSIKEVNEITNQTNTGRISNKIPRFVTTFKLYPRILSTNHNLKGPTAYLKNI